MEKITEMDPSINRKGDMKQHHIPSALSTSILAINGHQQYILFILKELETGDTNDVLTIDGILMHMKTVCCKVPAHAAASAAALSFLWSDSNAIRTDLIKMIQYYFGNKVTDGQRIGG